MLRYLGALGLIGTLGAWSADPGPGHVDQAQAKDIAIKAVGGGTVRNESEGTEAGQAVYTFGIAVKRDADVERVTIRASDGQVIGETYAGPQQGA